MNYRWDANCNLLNDGISTYTYDPANRLAGVTQGSNTYTYAYNGSGDRLQQTVNEQTTNYTLDLNAGLTQVLEDGTNTYTYGLDRISQQHGSTAEYYLGDALGSVRQMTDASDAITFSESYDPYGKAIQSAGSSTSIFGYTGEQADQTGLTYLRARYYDPAQARFLSRDTWEGNSTQPISYNSWAYANANPILYIDPTGHTPLVAAILAALVGPAAGFVVGAAVGGTFGYTMYPSAIVGQCGCEMQQQAIAAKGPWQFAGANALGAGVMGGYAAVFAEAGMAAGPIGMVVVGGVGLTIAGSDLWHTYNIIKNETGPTTCTIARLLMDVASMALSGVAFYAGVAGWRASGSWFSWTSVEPGTWGIRYGTKGASYEEFVRKFFNNPSDENLYVDNGSREVRFDAWDPIKRVLIDAKSSSGSSNYDFVLTQEWARVNVLSEAEDQVAAAQLKGVKVAWYVNNSSTAATLQTFFSNMNVPIVVKYFPGP